MSAAIVGAPDPYVAAFALAGLFVAAGITAGLLAVKSTMDALAEEFHETERDSAGELFLENDGEAAQEWENLATNEEENV